MKRNYTYRLFVLGFFLLFTANANAITYYWVRATAGNWNTNSSWSLTSAGAPLLTANPGAGDIVIFDNGGAGACSMVANVTVAACSLRVNFVGSLNLGTTTFTTSGSMVVAGGSFTHVSGGQNHQGTFTQTGGSCTFATNAIVLIIGDFLRTGGGFSASMSTEFRGNVNTGAAGTFVHNGGTVRFSGVNQSVTSASSLCAVNITPITTTTLTISGTVTCLCGAYLQGTGAITINGGILNSSGGIFLTNTSTTGGGNGTVYVSGTGNFSFSGAGAVGQSRLPNVTITKTAGTLTMSNNITVTGNFLYDPSGTSGCIVGSTAGALLAMSGTATLTTYDPGCTAGYPFCTLPDLTLMTGCYVQLGSFIQIRNILFQPLSQLDVTTSNHWITMYGTWINQSTSASSFNERAGRVSMGSGSLTSSVTGGESFYELEMVDPAGSAQLTMNSRVNIISMLRDVTVTNYNAIFNSTSAPLVFLDNATMWYSNPLGMTLAVTGPVIKIGNDAFSFPVGTMTGPFIYSRPITISAPAQPTDQFTAQYYPSNSNALYSHASRDVSIQTMSDCEYWTLNRTAGFSSVYVTLSWWQTATPQCDILNPADVVVCRWDGATWRNHGQSSNTWFPASVGSFTSALPISSFSPFTLGSTTMSNPLPVELTSFSAEAEMNHVHVQWSTATETNNDYFIVEKSTDGSTVQSVDTIPGNGTSSSIHVYSLTDYAPFDGQSYYRLTQVDFDGRTTRYDWQPVTITTAPEIHCYPNPSQGELHVELPGVADEYWTATVTDITGNVVWFSQAQRDVFRTIHIDLPPGTYVMLMASTGVNYSQRLVITE